MAALDPADLLFSFIVARVPRSGQCRHLQSADISNQAKSLQVPDQQNHEHDYVEHVLDRAGHRNVSID